VSLKELISSELAKQCDKEREFRLDGMVTARWKELIQLTMKDGQLRIPS
jgi:hypothetical protein